MGREGNSAFISCDGTGGEMGQEIEMGREMGGDGRLRSSVVGRDADGRSDGTRTGLMNGVQQLFCTLSGCLFLFQPKMVPRQACNVTDCARSEMGRFVALQFRKSAHSLLFQQ